MTGLTCPKCGDLCHHAAKWCPRCDVGLIDGVGRRRSSRRAAGRQRWFCSFCGRMTARPQGVCGYCADLPNLDPNSGGLDSTAPDPLESLPLMAADIVQGEDSQTPEGKVS